MITLLIAVLVLLIGAYAYYWFMFSNNFQATIEYRGGRYNIKTREYRAAKWKDQDWEYDEREARRKLYNLLKERKEITIQNEKLKRLGVLGLKDIKKYEKTYPEDFL